VHIARSVVAGGLGRTSPPADGLAYRAAVSPCGSLRWRGVRFAQEHSVLAGAVSRLSWIAMRAECGTVPPNLSLNPDRSPAALARRPLADG